MKDAIAWIKAHPMVATVAIAALVICLMFAVRG